MQTTRVSWLLGALGSLIAFGCSGDSGLQLPADTSGSPQRPALKLVARLAHISDTHVVDTLSPARFTEAYFVTLSAWRPYEAYAAQLADGMIRTVNRIHASGRTIDFLLHTGDACDNVQSNELAWLISLMDGGLVDPLSGPDDRPPEARPPLDPYAAFTAQGLYRTGVHGPLRSVPWYAVFGNHDRYSVGVFPIVEDATGHRTAPLPLDWRPGLLLPVRLDPVANFAYANVTPADPGPPAVFAAPHPLVANPARAYFSKAEYIQALQTTLTGPAGHGLAGSDAGLARYSVSPVPGLRLIALDTTDRPPPPNGFISSEGALSREQLAWLQGELDAAAQRSEVVVVASHHPSETWQPAMGSAVTGQELRDLLNSYPNVVLHLAGHSHVNRVTARGGYLEIETCSTLDLPQEGRLVEIWHDPQGGSYAITYAMFSHLDDTLPALGDDPLRDLRAQARAIARGDKAAAERQRHNDPSGADPYGRPEDRVGVRVLRR